MSSATSSWRRHLLRDRSGVVTLEFGLIAAGFLLLVLSTIEISLYLFTQQSLQLITGQVARAAVIGTVTAGCPITLPSGISVPPILAGSSLRVCVTANNGGGQTSYVVTGSYNFTFFLPIFAANSGTISEQVSPKY